MECLDRLGEQVNISKSLVGNLCSSDSLTWSVDSLDVEQELLSLQEQLHAEKDMRVVLEVQDEKWGLGMDDEFSVKKAWVSDLLKRARPIQRNSVNYKLATERIKNPSKGKATKVKWSRPKKRSSQSKRRSSRAKRRSIWLKRKASWLWRYKIIRDERRKNLRLWVSFVR